VVTTWVTDLEKNFSSFCENVNKPKEDVRYQYQTYSTQALHLQRDLPPNIIGYTLKVKDELRKGLLVMLLPLTYVVETVTSLLLLGRLLVLHNLMLYWLLLPGSDQFLLQCRHRSIAWLPHKDFILRLFLSQGMTRETSRGRVFIVGEVNGLSLEWWLSLKDISWIGSLSSCALAGYGSNISEG